MTLAELCFIIATVALAIEALPLVRLASPVKLLPAGLAFMAFALALGSGLAVTLGVTGKII